MMRWLRIASLSFVALCGLAGSQRSASAHEWWPSPARILVHRNGYLSNYGPTTYNAQSMYGRRGSVYTAPNVSLYSGPTGYFPGAAPGFYPPPVRKGWNYYRDSYDYSYGW
jgi:hypothetical protein